MAFSQGIYSDEFFVILFVCVTGGGGRWSVLKPFTTPDSAPIYFGYVGLWYFREEQKFFPFLYMDVLSGSFPVSTGSHCTQFVLNKQTVIIQTSMSVALNTV